MSIVENFDVAENNLILVSAAERFKKSGDRFLI